MEDALAVVFVEGITSADIGVLAGRHNTNELAGGKRWLVLGLSCKPLPRLALLENTSTLSSMYTCSFAVGYVSSLGSYSLWSNLLLLINRSKVR
jgi:hypothetical protein